MHRRRPGSRRVRGVGALTAVVLAAGVLAGCGAVELETYALEADDRAACEAFVADLPRVLADETQVEVGPADALGAAYGDPAITVTCGIPVPEGFDQTSRCDQVNGVGWYVPVDTEDDTANDLRVSVPGFRPIVEVVVPSGYRPADPTVGDDTTAAALSVLSPLVEEHLTLQQRCAG